MNESRLLFSVNLFLLNIDCVAISLYNIVNNNLRKSIHIKEELHMGNILNKVITTNEASSEFGIADCTIRQWIDQKLLDEGDYRKSGRTWIMKRESFLNLLRKKKMYDREFEVEGKKMTFRHLGKKGNKLEVWYENDRVKDILLNMPHASMVFEAFQAYKEDSGLGYKYVLVSDDLHEADNWLYRKSKTWVITLRSVLELILETLSAKGIDKTSLEMYVREKEFSV